jgi:hypothetical protein
MKPTPKVSQEPENVLFRIQRGLAGFISYLAACEMKSAFSEYVLYEPILRILMARGYSVICECPFPLLKKPTKRGDHKRIDFVAEKTEKPAVRFALEVKWAKKQNVNVKTDYQKLLAFHEKHPDSRSFLCVFGQWNHTKNLTLSGGQFTTSLEPIYALMKATQYGCRIYELDGT